MQSVLITGANGFVGNHLINILKDEFSLIVTGRDPVMENGDAHMFFRMDITSEEEVTSVFKKTKPDIVVHLAALSKPDECELNREKAFDINTRSVGYLLKASAEFSSHFIFLSTDFVFDGAKGMYVEDDLPAPVNYYGKTKLQAEELVKQYPFDWCIIRTVLVYGPVSANRENILTMAEKALRNKKPLQIVNDQVRTPTFVTDLCKGILSVIDHRAKGIYHISGRNVMTPYEMVIAMATHFGLDAKLVKPVTQDSFSEPARRPLKTGFDISKARRELKYEPVSFMEGIIKTFASQTGPQRH